MGFPIRVAQADCGRPSLFCVADQNSSVLRGLFASGMEENRTFEKGSPALCSYSSSKAEEETKLEN